MPGLSFRISRWLGIASAAFALAACHSGGGGGGGGVSNPSPPAGNVTISGTITYDFVPATAAGLDYAATETRPVREATVLYLAGATVVASTATDENGDYSLTVPANRSGRVRVRAETIRTGASSWDFRVVDNVVDSGNVNGDALYVLDGATASSGTSDSTRDLHAASGWTGSGYGAARAAAPFAILDTIYQTALYLVDAGATSLPALVLHWSEDNVATFGAGGDPDPASGEIGTTFFGIEPGLGINGIYLLGDENNDTEEYDRAVIVHEFGHYIENMLGRSDSIGGPHGRGDYLDMRVAFSEGWVTGFAGLVLGDPMYTDTGGPQQADSFRFSVEGSSPFSPNPAPGWYSSESVWELVYDLADTGIDGNDILNYPASEILALVTGPVADTRALVSIFPLLNAFKDAHPADGALLDLLTDDQDIGPVNDDYGDDEDNDAGADFDDVLPIYSPIAVNGAAINLCSTDEFIDKSWTGGFNKLSSSRFLRFTAPATGTAGVTVTATAIPAGTAADPDWLVHDAGLIYVSEDSPNAACLDVANDPMADPSVCVEPDPNLGPVVVPVTANEEYVIEIYEWTNTLDIGTYPEFPPIGRTCFDVTVTQ